jgi:predicted nucleic acid-binding protein
VVLIDTSIWIALYRKRSRALGQRLWQLAARNEAAVCGQVWVEFIGGFRNGEKRAQFADQLRAYPWLDTPRAACELAADWCASHPSLGAGDTLIAASAVINGAELMTLDSGFTALRSVGLKVVELS